MPPEISITATTSSDGIVHLGETMIPDDAESLGTGEARLVSMANTGTTMLRDIEVSQDGDSVSYVQLAVDNGGSPGTWAAPGESIIITGQYEPGAEFAFWARTQYNPDDVEGQFDGDLIIKAISS